MTSPNLNIILCRRSIRLKKGSSAPTAGTNSERKKSEQNEAEEGELRVATDRETFYNGFNIIIL